MIEQSPVSSGILTQNAHRVPVTAGRTYLFSMLLGLLLLTSCSTAPTPERSTQTQPGQVKAATNQNLQSLLLRAENSSGPRANNFRIRAAELATANGNLEQASNILLLVDNLKDAVNMQRFLMLQAEIAIQNEDASTALQWLGDDRISTAPLSQQDQIEYGQLRAQAFYIGRSYVASARERIFLDSLLSPLERTNNHEEIFSALMELPAKSLTAQARKAITSDLRGWLSLAAMTKQYQNDPLRQLQELNRWKAAWKNHPASIILPSSLQTLSKVVEDQPKNIALLLPLQGNLGPYGRAIRDGIIAARYQLGTAVQINVYDSSTGDIEDLINQAYQSGAELIIGPLDRSLVTQIAHLPNIPVPVLALNRTIDFSTHPDLYQFGLAPEDEMVQVADQVFKEGKRNALALYPATNWGARNFEAFRNRWISLGGNIIGTADYADQKDYSELIKSLLDVDQSEKRAGDVRRIVGQQMEFSPRRRQDIDFIFLLGNQSQARGINPTLAFYYAEDIPVYSTSHVYEYNESRIESIDLNGIRFCDIPWKLTNDDAIQAQVQNLWPNSRKQLAPFYALGVDAFRLYPRLEQLKVTQGKIYGATGILQLNENNILVRKLLWAQFSKGQVISSPRIVPARNES